MRRNEFRSPQRKEAQTLALFALSLLGIVLLCGLSIDSGLLYLAKARLARAIDGAALDAIGNFHLYDDPVSNRDAVALVMRNIAVANYTNLSSIGGAVDGNSGLGDPPSGGVSVGTDTYFYNFNDTSQDANGQYRRFVQITLTTGSGGGITSAVCNARCPVTTYFMGLAGTYFRDLKVSYSATASRNPRLIMIVVDRSGSMLSSPGGGAYGLPQSIVTFLDFFDTSSDNIGIVSFGSNARLEMPLTTNFITAGTNVLVDSYQIDTDEGGYGVPGIDPESETNDNIYALYPTLGVRRMKFGGATAADDGIRMGMEQLMANSGFNDPDVVKYMVVFTDGKWNCTRTLFAAPGYTNVITCPQAETTNVFMDTPNLATYTNNGAQGPWNFGALVNSSGDFTAVTNAYVAANSNILAVPSMGSNPLYSNIPYLTNALLSPDQYLINGKFENLVAEHLNETWQSADGINEPLGTASNIVGEPISVVNTTWVGQTNDPPYATTNYYTHHLDVWLPPGAVDYVYHNGGSGLALSNAYVSSYTNATPTGTAIPQNISVYLNSGDQNVLVMPGYVADGLFYDNLDLAYFDNSSNGYTTYPRYRIDNFNLPFVWNDDSETMNSPEPFLSGSTERQLMFRNYVNLLTGFNVLRADDPPQTPAVVDGTQYGYEPIDATYPSFVRPLNGLGPYYPGAAFYWPFDLMGIDTDPRYMLINPSVDPDSTHQGYARHLSYSINMLSTNATPEWAGEWFYEGTGGTNVLSGLSSTSASTLMTTKAQWQNNAPSWLVDSFDTSGEDITTNEPSHNTTLGASVWRPLTFNGSNTSGNNLLPLGIANVSQSGGYASETGGYVTDGQGNYYMNAMGYSGRPTHYFDFSKGTWVPVSDNHQTYPSGPGQALGLGIWKAQEYAWHARALGVTIYTVGYGSLVDDYEQVLLAEIANATNTTAGGGTNISFNPNQPIGQQFYAQTTNEISNDFYSIGQAINAALTQ